VPSYRIYLVKNNRLAGWEDIEAPHDLAAIEVAGSYRGDHHVELWFDRRKITTFDALQPRLEGAFLLCGGKHEVLGSSAA
jgi:hypothetical protein